MARLSICRRCLRLENDFSGYRFMRHVAFERREVMKIVRARRRAWKRST
jgi:hypothetical protein